MFFITPRKVLTVVYPRFLTPTPLIYRVPFSPPLVSYSPPGQSIFQGRRRGVLTQLNLGCTIIIITLFDAD